MDELSVVESVEAGLAPASAARSVKDIPLGITRGMASDDYHAERSAVSSSQLKRMLVSPAHFMCGLNEPEESTEAMLFGTVLHGRMLESDSFTTRFFATPKVNWQTKEGKALARGLPGRGGRADDVSGGLAARHRAHRGQRANARQGPRDPGHG